MNKYEEMLEKMPDDQKEHWKNYPLKVMVGQKYDEGFNGLDLLVSGNNEAMFISMAGLAKILVEMMDKNICNSMDDVGILIVLGETDKISTIYTKY